MLKKIETSNHVLNMTCAERKCAEHVIEQYDIILIKPVGI